jgi:apolipoprotein N-acyltransferase
VLLRAAAAVIAGVLVAVGFEPYGWFWSILPGLVLLTASVRSTSVRRAALLGFLFGLAFMLTLLPWIKLLGYDVWVGLSALEASFFVFVGVGLLLVSRLPGWPFWSASLWLLGEELRSVVPWGGFPWGRLAFASVDTPYAALMPYLGTAGTSFAIALTAFGLYGLVSRQTAIRREGALQLVLVVAVTALAALLPWSPMAAKTPPVNVAAVQGNVPGTGVESFSEQRVVLNNHVNATLDLAARVAAGEAEQPDLVLWPENSTDIDPFSDATVYADISAAVNAIGVPTLVGAMVQGEDPHDVYNQGIVWTPGLGAGESYTKRHPVPFGEYIPMRDFLAQ